MAMNQKMESSKWWERTAIFFLVITIGTVIFNLYSLWLVNHTSELGPLIAGFYVLFTLYTSLGLTLLSIIGMLIGFFIGYSLKKYVAMLVISLVPVMFFGVFR